MIKLMFLFLQERPSQILKCLHLGNSMVESGSQPWQPARLPWDTETVRERLGSANLTQRNHSNMTSATVFSLSSKSLPTQRLWVISIL